jgi:hypothetical protein
MSENKPTDTASGASLSTDGLEVRRLRAEVFKLNEKLRRKNIALDAMAWVWCDGGCDGGVYRRVDMVLTEEVVARAERNTKRLRRWLENRAFKARWESMTNKERSEWIVDATRTSND